jgi:molybdopterin biosynthesis enzyme
MVTELTLPQRIAQLTPLADVLGLIDRIGKAPPREIAARSAHGLVLAAEAAAPVSLPASAIALRDGWAVSSEAMRDAGSYARTPLPYVPARVDAGESIPAQCDTVAPLDSVIVANGRAEALASVTPGEGLLPAGGDADPARPLRRAGERLRASDIAVLGALGIAHVSVRAPRIRLVRIGADSRMKKSAFGLIAAALATEGAIVMQDEADFAAALRGGAEDAIIGLGGTGSGRNDDAVETLARLGKVEAHGIGLMPGETSAFGLAGQKPVLLLPGAIDAALAAWLVLGRALMRRLTVHIDEEESYSAALSRKVASTIGIADVILVRRTGENAEPLTSGTFPLSAIAQANGWVLVPAEREGYAAGTRVSVRPLP